MLVAGVLFMTFLLVPNIDPETPMTLKDYLHPLRPSLLVHYMTGLAGDTNNNITLSISIGMAQFLLLGTAMWVWIGYRRKTV
jgi:hypothetical protein